GTGPVAVGDLVDDDPAAEAVLAARSWPSFSACRPCSVTSRHHALLGLVIERPLRHWDHDPVAGPLGGPACHGDQIGLVHQGSRRSTRPPCSRLRALPLQQGAGEGLHELPWPRPIEGSSTTCTTRRPPRL